MSTKPTYHQWETVEGGEDANAATNRMRVPGGWLYRRSYLLTDVIPDTMVFVPYCDERMEAQRDFAVSHTEKLIQQQQRGEAK